VDVIVLDGDQRSALAVTRSLGMKGLCVAVGAERIPSLASCSKYCKEGFRYPSPYQDVAGFIDALSDYAARHPASVIYPMTDVTVAEILSHRAAFDSISTIPFPDLDKYYTLSDKVHLLRLARDLKIPIPKSFLRSDFGDTEELLVQAETLGFPVVVKPAFSRMRTADGWIGASVRYAENPDEFRAVTGEEPFRSHPFIVQERIEGPGIGIFLLMKEGRALAQFAHKRIREKPPSGGVSVLCESIEPPSAALDAARRLLHQVNWYGVAMVEFKLDKRDNIPKLMEVNARFWGSLQLAVSAGVDFPYLLYRLAKGENIEGPDSYKTGILSRWELGDLDHLLICIKNRYSKLSLTSDAPPKLKVFKDFCLDFARTSVRNEILRSCDASPFLLELKEYMKSGLKGLTKSRH